MDSLKKSMLSRVGIVVAAALLIETISIIQYQRVRSMIAEDMEANSRVVLAAMVSDVEHVMEMTERTMNENLWIVRRYLHHPDSCFAALKYLIDDNPDVSAGFLAYVPGFFPSRDSLFEPCVRRTADGGFEFLQLGGPEHDYTAKEFFFKTQDRLQPSWTNPYTFRRDSVFKIITYVFPLVDEAGHLEAVCGLDMDLSWLGDTLNVRIPFQQSYGLILTKEGVLVAGPPSDRVPLFEVKQMVAKLNKGFSKAEDKNLAIRCTSMDRDPFWQVVHVYRTDEVFSRVLALRRQSWILVLLGLAVLFFMIERFTREERKLRLASAEQARLSGELSIAQHIQTEMLPKEFPADIYGLVKPALEVGGDIFDFYRRDGKIIFCIGDVSGKGVPAAMLMSVVHSLFRLVSRREESPSRILSMLNEQICLSNKANMFVTFFVGCLDYYTGKLYYANAGHDKPFLLGDAVELLPAKAHLPLGVFPDTVFEEQSLVLSSGQTLFLYTDGLTEARNKERKNFGRDRLKRSLEALSFDDSFSPESLVLRLSESVSSYIGSVPQSDDLTMLVLRYAPSELIRESLSLLNSMDEIPRLGEFVKAFFDRLGCSQREASRLRLALEESVVNVISYAYPSGETGEISVFAESDRKEVRFVIVDSGLPFDPTSVLAPDTTLDVQSRPIGGLGILLTRKLVDSVSYCRKHGNNVLSLTKTLL